MPGISGEVEEQPASNSAEVHVSQCACVAAGASDLT